MVSSYAVSKNTPQQGSLWETARPFSSQRTSFSIPCKVVMVIQTSSALKHSATHTSTTTSFVRKIGNPPVGGGTSLIRKKHAYCCATKQEHGNTRLTSLSSFIRPYATFGLVLSMLSTSILPVQTMADLSPTYFLGVLKAVIAMVLIFIYNVSINQVSDIEIDKINKPYLPLASGEFSMKTVVAITILTSFLSLLIGMMLQSPPLICAILTFFLFGGAYSINLPFLRWKRNAIMAIVCTVAWGLSMKIGIFLHIQCYVLSKPMLFTRSAIFAIIFQVIFSIATALLKDLPDLEGDKAQGCDNMTIRFGKEKVFWGCTVLLLSTYCGVVFMGLTSPFGSSKLITVIGHSAIAVITWLYAQRINLSDTESTQSFYMFIWKDRKLLTCATHSSSHDAWKLSKDNDSFIERVRDFGLESISRYTHRNVDRALFSTLVERWQSETCTFHFWLDEMTISIDDAKKIVGVPIEGDAVVAMDTMSHCSIDVETTQKWVVEYLGVDAEV